MKMNAFALPLARPPLARLSPRVRRDAFRRFQSDDRAPKLSEQGRAFGRFFRENYGDDVIRRTAHMKARFYVIASGGEHYDEMKRAWIRNWEREDRSRFFPDAELKFLYCIYSKPGSPSLSPSVRWGGDVFADAEESVIPGILSKTLASFKEDSRGRGGDSWIVRSNLSSFYLWKELRQFLDFLEGEGVDASGYSGTEDHFSGCGFVLGPRAKKCILESEEKLDFSVEDDVAMSKVIFAEDGLVFAWAPRVDILGSGIYFRRCDETKFAAFHFRVKSDDRRGDAAILRAFSEDDSRARKTAETGTLCVP